MLTYGALIEHSSFQITQQQNPNDAKIFNPDKYQWLNIGQNNQITKERILWKKIP